MAQDEFMTAFRAVLKDVTGNDGDAVHEGTTADELGLDSLSLMELIVQLEDRLGRRFDDHAIRTIETVGDLAAIAQRAAAA